MAENIENSIEMQDLREKAYHNALEGHSFIITGQCGTGKTYLLRRIIKDLKQKKVTAVTATTGMASLQLGCDATTLHHWSGIYDGRYSHATLEELFQNDDNFAVAKERIERTECLIIDEISMLSAAVFDMVEFVCRIGKKNNSVFGGIQVIGCGDFKQLPPVPNRRYQDDGQYCFQSVNFFSTFPHHINLHEVVRQSEPLLIKAVNELCDGEPSEETVQFLRSLDRSIDAPAQEVTKLFGTNFDASVINQDTLEEMPGATFHYKATDEGEVRMLRDCTAPKHLVLKEGAKVILIKNIAEGLFNGMKGIVHKLHPEKPPIINFNGKLFEIPRVKFDVFDPQQRRTLASRSQFPVILAFALTVHRAQGQTLDLVEVDCYSFFAPGQMGVAVGRATKISGLRVLNFNSTAAFTKHPDEVFQFYERPFTDFSTDLHCCEKTSITKLSSQSICDEPSTSGEPCLSGTIFESSEAFPQKESPWDIHKFLTENQKSPFILEFSDDFFHSLSFERHVKFLYHQVCDILNKTPKSPQDWTVAYSEMNTFLLSDKHSSSVKTMFQRNELTKDEFKLSTKIVLWFMDKEIEKKAEDIIQDHIKKTEKSDNSSELSDAALAKLRYLAGACVQKVAKRIKDSVLRKVGKSSKRSRIIRKLEYRKQIMLKNFRIREADVDEGEESMREIEHKQGPTRGLTVVSEPVFSFFKSLHKIVQKKLTKEHFHLFHEDLHNVVRRSVDSEMTLADEWISLFNDAEVSHEEVDDEIFITLVMELYRDVTEHFIRISFVDALRNFKRSVPRKKKQALRTKVQALGEREDHKKKKVDEKEEEEEEETFSCNVCKCNCEWEPTDIGDESIACDKCNTWFHYKCVNLKGNEAFLKKKSTTWYCSGCSKKGKGRGKRSSKK
ncbi:uncharacterized protein LOC134277961 [Saccostrea cucullata]|uniref:uncharacterized protein LOC134277961 n=1 Tax=Saccostrea cuccullata TaxID=36930 RepID=UPI002ED2F87F